MYSLSALSRCSRRSTSLFLPTPWLPVMRVNKYCE
jgi:hypothetical protein